MDERAIWTLWGPLLTIALIFVIRFRRAGQERVLLPSRLWIVPLLVVVALGFAMVMLDPPPLGWIAFSVGALAGSIIGWHRGKLTTLRRDPESGAILKTVSPLAVAILLGIVALRFFLQREYGAGPPNRPASLAAIMLSDSLIGLGGAIIVFTRIEVALRVRALLAAARTGG